MPQAARLTDLTTHLATPLSPGIGSPDVEIGEMKAWRALPAGMGAGIEKASGIVKALMDSPSILPPTVPANLADLGAGFAEDAGNAATYGATSAPGTVASGLSSLIATNVTQTATYNSAAAVPGGEPAARQVYTLAIQA